MRVAGAAAYVLLRNAAVYGLAGAMLASAMCDVVGYTAEVAGGCIRKSLFPLWAPHRARCLFFPVHGDAACRSPERHHADTIGAKLTKLSTVH